MSNVTKLVGISYVNGIIKSDGSNGFAGASAGTDYQAPITLTTTGTSGVASFSSGTLNIPNYGDSIGAAGSAGTSGSSGTSGSAGTSGTSGSSGSSGSTGTSGSSGSTGTSGSSGSTGSSGSSGSTGSSGSSGTSGSSGSTGSSGSSGSTGSSGSSGSSGQSGAAGSSGSSGQTGGAGSSGTSGTSPSAAAYVAKAGDTMTGQLIIDGLNFPGNTDSLYVTNKRGSYFPLRVIATQGDYQGILFEHVNGSGSGGPGANGAYGFKFDDQRNNNYSSHTHAASFIVQRSGAYAQTDIFAVVNAANQKSLAVASSGAVTLGSTLQATSIGINDAPTGTKLFANQTTAGEWTATFKNYGTTNSYGVSIDMSGSTSTQSAFQVYTAAGNGIRVLNSNGGLLVGTFTDISGKLVVKQPYTSATTPIYFGNSSFTAWNRNSYDTMILQQDDVASFRMVEKNGEANTSDQILCFSIGDGVGRIATSGQPLQFYVNGSPTGVTYQGLSGTQVLVMNTNGSAQFNYALGVSGAATLSTTALISGKLTAAGGYYLYGGGYNTSYTPDGLWGGSATPNKVQGVSGGNFILGYNDNGSGLYAPAYGFEVRQTDGLGANITMDAIIMRNTETGARPFIVTNKGSLTLAGSLSKGSGSFKINHPLQSKKNKNYLVHSFLEGPKADLLYRGKINLVNGLAIINIDTTAGMTEGTFEVLCRDIQCFTTNESGWDLVKGTVTGNILTITSQNSDSNDLISWLVIGERQDEHMYETEWTDENGRVILEPEIPEGVIL